MERTLLDIAPGALSEYYDWLKASSTGDVLVYWIGDLQFDRSVELPETDVMLGAQRLRIAALNVVAERIYDDAKEGLLTLTQKRIDQNVFEYRATRRRTVQSKPVSEIRNDNLILA